MKKINFPHLFNMQICVADCPDDSFSPLFDATTGKTSEEDIKKKMKAFCRLPEKQEEFNKLSVKELVQEGICPPW